MKYLNPGMAELMDTPHPTIRDTTYTKTRTGYAVEIHRGTNNAAYVNVGGRTEIWFSYDAYYVEAITDAERAYNPFVALDAQNNVLVAVAPYILDGILYLQILTKKNNTTVTWYTSDKKFPVSVNTLHNLEFHFKTGENGRLDIWVDTKLYCSFRSPTAFSGTITKCGIGVINPISNRFGFRGYYSSFILQDTRRIGLERFVPLTIDPDTEQNMAQGSITSFKLSGLSDSTEYSDITSVCAVLQATSRDANITTGTFSLKGADIGTIDVSDSSGKSYEIAHQETNSATGKPWTRDDIEGQSLSFKVNGAT